MKTKIPIIARNESLDKSAFVDKSIKAVSWRGGIWHLVENSNKTLAKIDFREKKIDILGFIAKIDAQNKEKARIASENETMGTPPQENIGDNLSKNVSTEPKKRGRKAKTVGSIIFPKGEFTVKSVAETNKVEPYAVSNEMQRLRKIGQIFIITKTKKSPSGRGKPQNFFKIKLDK